MNTIQLVSGVLLLGLLLGAVNANAAGNYSYVMRNDVGAGENSVVAYIYQSVGSPTLHPASPFMSCRTASVDLAAFSAVIVWCESLGQFIAAAEYQ